MAALSRSGFERELVRLAESLTEVRPARVYPVKGGSRRVRLLSQTASSATRNHAVFKTPMVSLAPLCPV